MTAGFWDDIYNGPVGRFAGGLQYSFPQKFGFAGIGGAPKVNENIFFTSLLSEVEKGVSLQRDPV